MARLLLFGDLETRRFVMRIDRHPKPRGASEIYAEKEMWRTNTMLIGCRTVSTETQQTNGIGVHNTTGVDA